MGTPQPDPPVVGDTCGWCDDILWSAGSTPKHVRVQFSGIETCAGAPQPAPNGTFILTQTDLDACEWQYTDGVIRIRYEHTGPWSRLVACEVAFPNGCWFVDTVLPTCETHFINEYVACFGPPPYGKNGVGEISFPAYPP